MRFETVNKTTKKTIKNGNKIGIARTAMEKLTRAAAVSEALGAEEQQLVSKKPVSKEMADWIRLAFCEPEGKDNFHAGSRVNINLRAHGYIYV